MPIVHVPVQLTMEQLLVAVKQLSPDELREFAEQFAAWQEQHDQQDEEEAVLLAVVEENLRLPPAEQRRYEQLRRKSGRRTLTEGELLEYQPLLQQLEVRETAMQPRLGQLGHGLQ